MDRRRSCTLAARSPRRAARRRGAAGGEGLSDRVCCRPVASRRSPTYAALPAGTARAGLRRGQNIVIEYRWAEGQSESAPGPRGRAGSAQGRRHRHASSTAGAAPPSEATSDDPDRHGGCRRSRAVGLVASLARPGGNVTGLTTHRHETCRQSGWSCSRRPSRASRASRFSWNPIAAHRPADTAQDAEGGDGARCTGRRASTSRSQTRTEFERAFADMARGARRGARRAD